MRERTRRPDPIATAIRAATADRRSGQLEGFKVPDESDDIAKTRSRESPRPA